MKSNKDDSRASQEYCVGPNTVVGSALGELVLGGPVLEGLALGGPDLDGPALGGLVLGETPLGGLALRELRPRTTDSEYSCEGSYAADRASVDRASDVLSSCTHLRRVRSEIILALLSFTMTFHIHILLSFPTTLLIQRAAIDVSTCTTLTVAMSSLKTRKPSLSDLDMIVIGLSSVQSLECMKLHVFLVRTLIANIQSVRSSSVLRSTM
jgi:hypothetical protein